MESFKKIIKRLLYLTLIAAYCIVFAAGAMMIPAITLIGIVRFVITGKDFVEFVYAPFEKTVDIFSSIGNKLID